MNCKGCATACREETNQSGKVGTACRFPGSNRSPASSATMRPSRFAGLPQAVAHFQSRAPVRHRELFDHSDLTSQVRERTHFFFSGGGGGGGGFSLFSVGLPVFPALTAGRSFRANFSTSFGLSGPSAAIAEFSYQECPSGSAGLLGGGGGGGAGLLVDDGGLPVTPLTRS